MFEDILDPEIKRKNVRLICPYCGTKILEIIWNIDDENFEIQELDRHCRLCGGDTT